MFTSFDKAIVAVIMGILLILEQIFGWSFGLTEEGVTVILAVLTPIFVYFFPNKVPG